MKTYLNCYNFSLQILAKLLIFSCICTSILLELAVIDTAINSFFNSYGKFELNVEFIELPKFINRTLRINCLFQPEHMLACQHSSQSICITSFSRTTLQSSRSTFLSFLNSSRSMILFSPLIFKRSTSFQSCLLYRGSLLCFHVSMFKYFFFHSYSV